jgi:predicted MFS family arabinose efflux permease
VCYAVGVPVGTWIGLQWGWRWPLWLAAAASVCVWLLATRLVPAATTGSVVTGSLRTAHLFDKRAAAAPHDNELPAQFGGIGKGGRAVTGIGES